MGKSYLVLKRILDLVFSSLLLVVLSPLLLMIAIAIKVETPGPAIFRQHRLGKAARTFEIYKFRSMVVGAAQKGSGVYSPKGDPRVTSVGRIIRATSLDELPQLFNILKGDMSFIGPRPPLVFHPWPLEQYSAEQLKRFAVLPGITGLAQINGRKELPWLERIRYDIRYTEEISLILDIRILMVTVYKLISMDNNYNTVQTVTAKEDGGHETPMP